MAEEERVDDEAEDEGAAPAAEAAPSGSSSASKIIKILIYVVAGILVLFLVVGISFLVSKYVQEKSYQKEQDIVVAPPPPPLSHFDLPTFAVSTNDEEPHFAKITVSLAFEDNLEINNELVRRTVQIQHIVNLILRGKSYDELNSVEDSISLSEEIKAHVNVILTSGKIKEVYLKEFVVN